MNSETIKKNLDKTFKDAENLIVSGNIPCAVLGYIDINKNKSIKASGLRQLVPIKKKVNKETIFDLASLTKVLFTTHKILQLNESGQVDLNAPIAEYLPDLCQYNYNSWERKVTVKQCLNHSTPFPAVEPIYTYGDNPETLKAYILQNRWKKNNSIYSDINFIFLGLILERLLNLKIKEISTGYNFNFTPKGNNFASTEKCFWRNEVMCGKTHDENSYALNGAGHAGLFGNADSILDFAYDMLTGINISKAHIKKIQEKSYKNRSIGWEVANAGWSGGNLCSDQTIGHTGFTGTGLWIDFKNEFAWTLLTNRVHPSRHKSSEIVSLRVKISENIIRLFGKI